jgi:uncharacterized iron-regulated membrane protein
MGVGFALTAFLTNVALGSQHLMSLVSAMAGGSVVGLVTGLATHWKRSRPLDQAGGLGEFSR